MSSFAFSCFTLLTIVLCSGIVSASPGGPPSSGGGGGGLQIVYAINAGGKRHQDIYGIVYEADTSSDGVASDHGMRMNIERVHPNDEVLYQTERYSHSTFGYDIPVKEDGNYVLVLKFSEVYFRSPGQKIFNVVLNKNHIIVQDLDIYAYVGYARAHDEIIPFIVTDHGKKLIVGSKSSVIQKSRIRLDFVKGGRDNPKVNAFYVAKGSVDAVPRLPSLQELQQAGEEEEDDEFLYGEEDDEEVYFSKSDLGYESNRIASSSRRRAGSNRVDVRSGHPADDPWDDEPYLIKVLPLIASVGVGALAFVFVKFVQENL